ncbi:MAG: hypothetical protein QG632_670, partial [Candidatus Dependentiae bacterium]|nr:hypothetical protein [Candidatus Dependentiae bacterium]
MNIKRLRLLSLLLTIALATNSLHTTLPAADAGAEVSTLGKFNTHLKENTHKYAIGLGAAGLLNLAYLFKSGKLSKAKLKKLFAKENRAATTQLFFGSILPFLLAGGVEVNGYGSGYAKEQAKPQHNSSTAISHQSTAGEAPATTSETAPLDDAASNASSDILAAASAPTAEFSNSQNTKEEEATLLPASTVAGKNGDTSKSHVVAATAQGQRTQAEKPAQKPTKEMSASLVEKNPTITM